MAMGASAPPTTPGSGTFRTSSVVEFDKQCKIHHRRQFGFEHDRDKENPRTVCAWCCVDQARRTDTEVQQYYAGLLINAFGEEGIVQFMSTMKDNARHLSKEEHIFAVIVFNTALNALSLEDTVARLMAERVV